MAANKSLARFVMLRLNKSSWRGDRLTFALNANDDHVFLLIQIYLRGKLIELKYKKSKRVRGIEPLSLAWKARVLPLNYTRMSDGEFKSNIERDRRKHPCPISAKVTSKIT
jgi:hypothetical protein